MRGFLGSLFFLTFFAFAFVCIFPTMFFNVTMALFARFYGLIEAEDTNANEES